MDIWGAIGDAAGAVGDAIEGGVNAIVDTVEDGVDTIVEVAEDIVESGTEAVCNETDGPGCNAANIVGGVVLGIVHAGQTLFGDVADLVRDGGAFVGNILRGNWFGALNALINFVMHLGILLVDIGRTILLGPIANDIMRLANKNGLRRFVEDRIQTLFSNDPDRLNAIRTSLHLDSKGRWGLRVYSNHHTFFMDSKHTDLRRLHADGLIDLHELAGLTHGNFTRGHSIVRKVNPDGSETMGRIGRTDLNDYIDNAKSEVHIRAYAIENRIIAPKLLTARRKCREVGIELIWNDPLRFTNFGNYTYRELIIEPNAQASVNPHTGIKNLHPFHFDTGEAIPYLVDNGLRTHTWAEEATLIACAVFRFQRQDVPVNGGWKSTELFGVTIGHDLQQPPTLSNCSTPDDRTDQCCDKFLTTTIQTPDGEQEIPNGTGVFHRDSWPEVHSQFVLSHEIGHWLGLCHYGHNGVHNLMFTTQDGQGTTWSPMDLLLAYARGADIASFTYQDGENLWRHVLNQWPGRCL